uniref:Protein kinase domain-containing protein n=1 Tax=Rhabditophanes sp. KR3021 TaxID=114890 RepID=A0AC35U7U2_9BILA
MDVPKLSCTPGNSSDMHIPSNHNNFHHPITHDLAHFQNIFSKPSKNSLQRASRSETHLADIKGFAHPSEKVMQQQIHSTVSGFFSHEGSLNSGKISAVSSSANNMRKLRDEKVKQFENPDKGEQGNQFKGLHPLSSLLLRGNSSSSHNLTAKNQIITEENDSLEKSSIPISLPPRVRKSSSASRILDLANLTSEITIDDIPENMWASSIASAATNPPPTTSSVDQGGLTMSLDSKNKTSAMTPILGTNLPSTIVPPQANIPSSSGGGWFSRGPQTTTNASGEIKASGSVLGIFGKGFLAQPVLTNDKERYRYMMTLEQ